MASPEPDFLSRSHRDSLASAGYRARRWKAAREVLGNRVAKGRIPGLLGQALHQWGVGLSPLIQDESFQLTFGMSGSRLWWCDDIAGRPLEQALLHLPALRAFWRQELRAKHFQALKSIVPKVWLKDQTTVPPGAVIHGLGISGWDQLPSLVGRIPVVMDEGLFLTERSVAETRINAFYKQDDQRRVVLRSIAALP